MPSRAARSAALSAVLSTALSATAVAAVATAAPASAAGGLPVYFVHGIDWNHSRAGDARINCDSTWKNAISALRAKGWTSPMITWGYYAKDTRCTRKFKGDLNTRIQELGRRLAWDIHDHYSKSGKPVAVVGHSMGGLVVRAALEGTRRYGANKDWPDRLIVRYAVTYSTPHTGTSWGTSCLAVRGWEQCSDVRPNSGFLRWAGQNPQGSGGTEWTLVGASDDDMITTGSATGMRARRKVRYAAGQGLEHSTIKNKGTGGTWKASRSNDFGKTWRSGTGAGPLLLLHRVLSGSAA
ncbi:esterase/lipase family protein [Actinomadura kijaniata]|uniref:esterase/lipase family protein n=1 Tax=Actinomadura kijaniata TaxID=46161 RepID=UPI003F1AC848